MTRGRGKFDEQLKTAQDQKDKMPLKKIDNRIRTLIENGVNTRHRSMFVVVGDKSKDQVVILHHMLSKSVVKSRPNVLWCYKKELGFSSHRKKRMRQFQKKVKCGNLDEDDPFHLFISSTTIRYCYYAETHKILGNTFGMCVLQDFEALTPNLLARTVETVEGGGVIVILLRAMSSLRQLYTMTMDVHARYRTASHDHIVARFNERFLLSLTDCAHCMVLDDQLNMLPISSHMTHIKPNPPQAAASEEVCQELKELQDSLIDTQPVGNLVKCCKTLDQAKALLKFVEAISEQTLRSTVAMTAARGRGKSAALGLAISAAVAFGYSNIFVTSPSPENLKTVFEFIFRGFDSLNYSEHQDYEIIQSTNPEFNKAVVRVNIFQQHRQTVQYIHPGDSHRLEQAELVAIDEAAAIPLPLVKKLLGPYLVFMASTVNGYEGTGRSLSLKLIHQLRQQNQLGDRTGRTLHEVSLSDPIRYSSNDPVEAWLHQLLCLDAGTVPRVSSGCPPPDQCQLYAVNRDTLFCYHTASEEFLHRMMSLCVSSHYKNTPNDLQLLSDAPAHHLFVLLGPITMATSTLPEILCVIQVCIEGGLSRSSVMSSLSQGRRASGDLIPWTLTQQFADSDFPGLSGARVVRIATHPDFQGMGYGSRALAQLIDYYQQKMTSLDEGVESNHKGVEPVAVATSDDLLKETISPRKHLPPLLTQLSDRPVEELDYVGVAYGLTEQLYRFWNRQKFVPVYLRQTPNELTGEHSCIMLRTLDTSSESSWLTQYHDDFKSRFISLLSYQFTTLLPPLALSILHSSHRHELSHDELNRHFSKFDLKRLELYSRNLADYHLITDLLPTISRLYFKSLIAVKLSAAQSAILVGMGLQHKTVEVLQVELDLPVNQILGLFNRMMRKFAQVFTSIEEKVASASLATPTDVDLQPIRESIDKELNDEVSKFQKQQSKLKRELMDTDLSQYSIASHEAEEWAGHEKKAPNIVSIAKPAGNKRPHPQKDAPHKKKVKKHKK